MPIHPPNGSKLHAETHVTLVAGRVSHAYGVSQHPEVFRFRISGMASTLAVIGIAAAICLFGALQQIFSS